MTGYKADFFARTITITKAFEEKMQNPNSDEYTLIKAICDDYPDMKVIKRTHASPTKYKTKDGKTFNCNQFKNLTYENMKGFINGLPDNVEYLRVYNFLRNCGSLVQHARYTVVRKWFVAQFPEFRTDPLFYLYNKVDVIDFVPFLREEEEKQAAREQASLSVNF